MIDAEHQEYVDKKLTHESKCNPDQRVRLFLSVIMKASPQDRAYFVECMESQRVLKPLHNEAKQTEREQ